MKAISYWGRLELDLIGGTRNSGIEFREIKELREEEPLCA